MTEDAMGIMERFGGTMTAAMGWDDEPRSSLLGHGARGLVSDVHLMATTTQPSKAPRNLIGIDDFVQWTDRGMRPDAGIRLEQRILDSPRVNLDILVADGRANRAVGARCDLARRRGTRGGRGRRPRRRSHRPSRWSVARCSAARRWLGLRAAVDAGCGARAACVA